MNEKIPEHGFAFWVWFAIVVVGMIACVAYAVVEYRAMRRRHAREKKEMEERHQRETLLLAWWQRLGCLHRIKSHEDRGVSYPLPRNAPGDNDYFVRLFDSLLKEGLIAEVKLTTPEVPDAWRAVGYRLTLEGRQLLDQSLQTLLSMPFTAVRGLVDEKRLVFRE